MDPRRRSLPSRPPSPGEPEAIRYDGLVAASVDRDAVGFVAELAGHTSRSVVALKGLGTGGPCVEMVEGERQQADLGFDSVPLALVS